MGEFLVRMQYGIFSSSLARQFTTTPSVNTFYFPLLMELRDEFVTYNMYGTNSASFWHRRAMDEIGYSILGTVLRFSRET